MTQPLSDDKKDALKKAIGGILLKIVNRHEPYYTNEGYTRWGFIQGEINDEIEKTFPSSTASTVCRHEAFEGRCVHCNAPFVNGQAMPSATPRITEVAFEHAKGSLQGMVERAADHPEEMNRIAAQVEGVLLKLIGCNDIQEGSDD